jgi:hypothetical protein
MPTLVLSMTKRGPLFGPVLDDDRCDAQGLIMLSCHRDREEIKLVT